MTEANDVSNRKSVIALVTGEDRFANCTRALDLVADTIDLSGKSRILIKPNFVSTTRQLAATHVEAVRAVVAFLRARTSCSIAVGESAAEGSAADGYRNFGYLPLKDQYGVELIDFDQYDTVEVEGLDQRGRRVTFHAARPAIESDFRVSVCPPKTHNEVIVTLSLKNMIVGSLRPKSSIHGGPKGTNLNLYALTRFLAPHLSVIDGFEGMEGDGPTDGSAVRLRTALAGTDFLAVDAIMARIMGFDVDTIGYLHYCRTKCLGVGDVKDIDIRGERLDAVAGRSFRPHDGYEHQLDWHIPGRKI